VRHEVAHDTGPPSLLTDEAALAALAPEWDALWHRVPGAAPFASPRWLLPWWRQWGTDRPRVATLRRAGRLAAVLPLYVLDEPEGPKLLPMGAGTGDYLDALAEPGTDLGALLAAALAASPDVAVCDLIEIPADGRLLGIEAPPGWRAAWRQDSACPVLVPGEDLAAVPAGTRRKLRMARHRAERAGGYAVETATAGMLPALFDALVTLHRARWEAAGEPGVLADPLVLAFHHDAQPGLLDAGLLRLLALRLSGRVAAGFLQLLQPGRVLFYLAGFDAGLAYHSPGTLLLGWALEQAAVEGREAHFLRGAEGYKFAWGAEDRPNQACRLVRS
jgi:CelD/BcsL family acetyltransferase involved in cellulose biosynthesis